MKEGTWLKLMELGARLGCHQMPERSFFYKGYQFPVCARCTGVILSTIPTVLIFFKKKIPVKICTILSSVMLIDWSLQRFHIKESTNKRRLITGLVGGFGYTTLHMYLYRWFLTLFRKEK